MNEKKRKIVLVDGIGYAAVGGGVGNSNAHVARELNAPVLLIGKTGKIRSICQYRYIYINFIYKSI